MRLFIEAVLEPSSLDEAWSAGQRMGSMPGFPASAVRWVKREAMHLTLRFLGEVDDDRRGELTASLARLDGAGRFDLRMVEVGTFGGRRPRVVWIGFARDDGFEALQRQRRRLDDALVSAGFDSEQAALRPHLTVGRVRRRATRQDLAAIHSAVNAAFPLDITTSVEQLALVQSTLLKDGPRYRRLALAEL